MIFLTVGTWHKGYDRLVKAIDELVQTGVIRDAVTAQVGYSSYRPKHLETTDFCCPEGFAELISRARLVISHAGMGTIIEAIKQKKPVVVLPRRRALGEVSNDHQFATARQLEAEGAILVAYDVSELPAKLQEAKAFVPARQNGSHRIMQQVEELLKNVAADKEKAHYHE